MSLADEIFDDFGELSPAERFETTASFLSQIADLMLDNNRRLFPRALDMIAETEGDEKPHLDMFAAHLAMKTSEVVDVQSWDIRTRRSWPRITPQSYGKLRMVPHIAKLRSSIIDCCTRAFHCSSEQNNQI